MKPYTFLNQKKNYKKIRKQIYSYRKAEEKDERTKRTKRKESASRP